MFITLVFMACNTRNAKKIVHKAEAKYRLMIAYNVLYDKKTDNYEVFSMELGGGNVSNITSLEGVEWVYHANGDDLYFVTDKDTANRNYQLYKMKADGNGKMKLSNIRLKDSWLSSRKNESEIIVVPHPKVDTAFYIIDTNSTILKKIKPGLKYFNDPSFSPDGEQIAFRVDNLLLNGKKDLSMKFMSWMPTVLTSEN